MSGRLSQEFSNPNGTLWNYASVPNSTSLQSPSHGRRSSIYRAQNSTLFSAFEEDGVALSDLPEEDESGDEERNSMERGEGGGVGRANGGRSLMGQRGTREGAKHPV